MDRINHEIARARHREMARADRNRYWTGELHGERTRDGVLRFFRLPRR